MAAVTAAMVKQLRDMTGQAMMDCKKALVETDGDVEKAIDLLRKKGLAVMEKRSERATKEGRVVSQVAADGQKAVLAVLSSETDFTAKSDAFGQAAEALAQGLLNAATAPDGPETAAELEAGNGKKVGEVINDIISTTGEKITVGPFKRSDLDGPGLLYSYVHFNGKVGTLLQIEAENAQAAGTETVKTLASYLAMHVTATNPMTVSRDDVDPEVVAREKEIAAGQITNKPANIIEKIVNGKMNKWFSQVALLEQPFVKDDSMTVNQLLEAKSKEVGAKLTVKAFARLQIG